MSAPEELLFKKLNVDHLDLSPDPRDIFLRSAGAALALANVGSLLDYALDFANESLVLQTGAGSELAGLLKDVWAGMPETIYAT